MRKILPVVVAGAPGILVVAAAILGWAPAARDLPTYFTPLRHRTAAALTGHAPLFWNEQAGCGEPYFANPQTGIAYPPAWSALILPAGCAVGLEVGFHLALLGMGCYVLARRLGADRWLAAAAGLGVACSGPVAGAAGVLNNLATTAWLPWLWNAALGGSVTGVAVCGAASYLAAEPQLAVLGALIALALAPTRKTAAGLGLAVSVVAVQAIPFACWVAGGDRGPGSGAVAAAATALVPSDLPALAFPGCEAMSALHTRFVPRITLPLWGVVLAVAAVGERATARARLAAAGWALVALAVLPSFPAGERLWSIITLGLVRHPARLLFPAAVALVTAAAACARRVPRRVGVPLLASLAGIGLLLDAEPWSMAAGAAGAAALLASIAPAGGALLGSLVLAPAAAAGLSFRFQPVPPVVSCVEAQARAQRVFVVEPSEEQARWVATRWPARAYDLGWGYTMLLDGRHTARTFAPLQSRALAFHLLQADLGPEGRWWLNFLGADTVVSHRQIAGLPCVCRKAGVVVHANPGAVAEAFIAPAMPEPGSAPTFHGEVLRTDKASDAASWTVRVGPNGGVLVRLSCPDRGWRYTVDGRHVAAVTGPGIVHGVPVPEGQHLVRAEYRPPGLLTGATITLIGLGFLTGVRWRRW